MFETIKKMTKIPTYDAERNNALRKGYHKELKLVNVLLDISPASIYTVPTFRNHVSVPSSKAGGRL
jgi:hypothetical protein